MKKVFLALAIFVFAGSVIASTSSVKASVEHNEKEGKKDKKKNKKDCHSSTGETKSCSKGTEGKGCCSKAKTEEKKDN
jgi:hypothetical protein